MTKPSFNRLCLVLTLVTAVAIPALAEAVDSEDTIPRALALAHEQHLREVVGRYLQGSVLTPDQERASLDGLATFSRHILDGEPQIEPEAAEGGYDLEPTPAMRDLQRRAELSSEELTNATSALNSVGAVVCSIGDELLVNGRFVIAVTYQGYVGAPAYAYSCRMTNSAGYFFFFDSTNVEIPVKMLNACSGGNPASHWFFGAGLTDFAVAIGTFDLFTGLSRTYTNSLGQVFNTKIDQRTPFPCP